MKRNRPLELKLLAIISETLFFNDDLENANSAEFVLSSFKVGVIIKNQIGVQIDSFELFTNELDSHTLGLFSKVLTNNK